jgi:hypothetical protein
MKPIWRTKARRKFVVVFAGRARDEVETSAEFRFAGRGRTGAASQNQPVGIAPMLESFHRAAAGAFAHSRAPALQRARAGDRKELAFQARHWLDAPVRMVRLRETWSDASRGFFWMFW